MFWVLVTAVVVIVVSSVESESFSGFWGFVAFVLFFVLLWKGGSSEALAKLYSFITQNPLLIIGSFIAYLGCGAIWSIVKWKLRLTYVRAQARERSNLYGWERKIDVSSNKGLIMGWMIAWPFSLIWTAIDEPILNAFNRIFSSLRKTFEKMSEETMKDIEEIKKKQKVNGKNSLCSHLVQRT